LAFYEARIPKWSLSATQIGVTPASVTALETRAAEAREAYTQHVSAQATAKSATLNWYEKLRLLHNATGAGADMVRQMRTKAVSTNDPNVYVLADIPAPATPSPVGPPGTPTDFKVTLNGDGSLKLTWKCPNPVGAPGTTYQIARQLGPDADFILLGTSGSRKYVDTTLPASAANQPVTYQITAIRSTVTGAPAQFLVRFGFGGGGMTASIVETSPKLAA
jgi:hypothetical protein